MFLVRKILFDRRTAENWQRTLEISIRTNHIYLSTVEFNYFGFESANVRKMATDASIGTYVSKVESD
jgi:hypothetical protein